MCPSVTLRARARPAGWFDALDDAGNRSIADPSIDLDHIADTHPCCIFRYQVHDDFDPAEIADFDQRRA